MEILSVSKAKIIDKKTIEEVGVPSIVLMENAGSEIAKSISEKGESFLICCGCGNNGGDGLVIARKLMLKEKKVKVEYVFQEKEYLPKEYKCPEERVKPWGTGHAILCCRDVINEPFAVINADDFYGKTAFQKIYDYLKKQTDNYCMVGFRLANTLTENGYVSRGVCEEENGFLSNITERTKIVDCKYTEDDINWIELSPDTIVSMNMWGFTPDIFEYLEREFVKFLEEKLTVEKSEFYLPSVVDILIKSGEKKARVIASEDKWYGVTYKEDKPWVVNAIQALIDAGEYPEHLWS